MGVVANVEVNGFPIYVAGQDGAAVCAGFYPALVTFCIECVTATGV